MTHQLPFFHSLLRPCVLQILRAQGYHAARPSVVDALTDLAARYLTLLCESTAHHTAHNSTELTGLVPSLVDVRLALEDCGALAGGQSVSNDDPRGVDEFADWFVSGPRHREIRRVALDGDDDENTDYLMMLKKKHSKTGEDSKYSSTVLGRGNVGGGGGGGGGGEHHAAVDLNGDAAAAGPTAVGDGIVVEGGDCPSITAWREKRIEARQQPRPPTPVADDDEDEEMDDGDDGDDAKHRRRTARSPSSGLSSLGDRSIDEEMELEFGVPQGTHNGTDATEAKEAADTKDVVMETGQAGTAGTAIATGNEAVGL
ncbi:hypothetical protein HMPREF1624_08051 [Sporothrix schenckii ATCC 58251]|uniref:Bromodomain associated domain-containing protein n=1 Tax=Sporothrix schenckii (strain ATCC 58251 / de Perez 2211183) TaxID=1391915 RepID=U7PM02_SPOS1|nr:hypothetical protein HMPREF1624_08051 [Sporothrix schenckii ATCC 58251]